MKVLWKRVLSAVVGIPVVIYLVYQGRQFLLLAVLVMTALGLYELQQILKRLKLNIPSLLFFGSGLLFPVLAYLTPAGSEPGRLFCGLTLVLSCHLIAMLLSFPNNSVSDLAASFFGSCYLGIMISFLIMIRNLRPDGCSYLLIVLILTWSCDIGAYCLGHLLGRHALWPKLSPKKTVEGAIGGLVMTVAVAIIIRLCFSRLFSYSQFVILGLLIGVFDQVGDLVESVWKRLSGVKDSGDLIPGHGGVLDRIDSLLFTAPLAYFYFKLFF